MEGRIKEVKERGRGTRGKRPEEGSKKGEKDGAGEGQEVRKEKK